MEEIRIIEKPDWITWYEIAECIHVGQATNNKKGFDMKFGHLTGEELQRNNLGESGEGYTFVALNENNNVVGTQCVTIVYLNKWWHKGRSGLRCNSSTLPEYRGTDVYFGLREAIENKEKELGINVVWGTTSEKNEFILKLQKKYGWKYVGYTPSPRDYDYFSYVMVKWKDGCPYNDKFINFRFKVSRIYSRIVYKFNGTRKVNRFTHFFHLEKLAGYLFHCIKKVKL